MMKNVILISKYKLRKGDNNIKIIIMNSTIIKYMFYDMFYECDTLKI